MSNRLEMIRKVKQQMSSQKDCGCKKNKFQEKIMENPCQEGYVAYGTKIKDGREVPNCIPDKEGMGDLKKDGFPIPSPSGSEDEQTFISRCMSELNEEFPDQSQRAAVCYKAWRGE